MPKLSTKKRRRSNKTKKPLVDTSKIMVTLGVEGSFAKYYLKECQPIAWTKHRKEAHNFFPDLEEASAMERELPSSTDALSSLPPGSYRPEIELENIVARVVSQPFCLTGLTRREREVAVLRLDGLQSGEIASRLSISTETVNSHLDAIFKKRGLEGRGALNPYLRPGNP